MSERPAVPDGLYDVMVVDVAERGGEQCLLSLAVSTGLARGEVIDLLVDGIDIDPLDLLGLPGTLEVADGVPRFRL